MSATTHLGGVVAGAQSFVLSEFARKHQAPLLIIARDIQHERQLMSEIAYYYPEATLLNFANYEVLPYDRISPHQDIISDRVLFLSQVQTPWAYRPNISLHIMFRGLGNNNIYDVSKNKRTEIELLLFKTPEKLWAK